MQLMMRRPDPRPARSRNSTYSSGVHPSPLGRELPVLPGRLQRLADELAEEGLPALDGAPDPVGALVELAYALRPQLHEGRVPTYGVLIPPTPVAFTDERLTGADSIGLIAVTRPRRAVRTAVRRRRHQLRGPLVGRDHRSRLFRTEHG